MERVVQVPVEMGRVVVVRRGEVSGLDSGRDLMFFFFPGCGCRDLVCVCVCVCVCMCVV